MLARPRQQGHTSSQLIPEKHGTYYNMSRLTITVTLLLISYHVFTSFFTEAANTARLHKKRQCKIINVLIDDGNNE